MHDIIIIQIIFPDHFRKYDYGKKGNIKYYHSETPPDYDLSQVIAATYIYHSKYDVIAPPKVKILKIIFNILLIETDSIIVIDIFRFLIKN